MPLFVEAGLLTGAVFFSTAVVFSGDADFSDAVVGLAFRGQPLAISYWRVTIFPRPFD
jgi:hypothetical protein